MAREIGRIEPRYRDDGFVSSYRIVIQWEGERWRIGHGKVGDHFRLLDTLDFAEFVLADIRAEASRCGSVARAVVPHLQRPDDRWLMAACFERWLERERGRCDAGQISPRTLEERMRQVGAWDRYFGYFDSMHVFSVTFGVIEDWQASLAGADVPPVMRKRLQESLASMLGWMEERGEIRAPRMSRNVVPRRAPRIHTPEAQRAWLAKISWERRGIFLAMAHTLRPQEARAIDLFGWSEPDMLVQRAFKGRKATSPIGGLKEADWRVVSADEELVGWIRWRLEQATPEERLRRIGVPLFRNPDTHNGFWSHDALRKQVVRACKRAGVEYVPPYAATKHTTSTNLIRGGANARFYSAFSATRIRGVLTSTWFSVPRT